jgi:NADPH2:quinone reductase
MKALLCTRLGGPDDLELQDLPEPVAGPGEAVVAIKAVALNFFDTLIIAGKYQRKPALPFSPGAEFSGIVTATGPGVTAFRPGDRVAGYIGEGAAREAIAVPADMLVRLPDALTFERAAGVTVTYGTSHYALKNRARLQPGETLAVLGASGGVGLAAVELGRIMGARVIACASTDDKLDFAGARGADELINYSRDDLKLALRRLTDGRGPDVVYDPIGGVYAEQALRATAWLGRFLVIGFAAGQIPNMPLNLPLLRNCDILGVNWGGWAMRDPAGNRANTEELMGWCATDRLSAHVHAVYPLAEARQALSDIATRKVMGKAILRP